MAGEWVDNEGVWVICATGSANLREVMLTYALFGLACETDFSSHLTDVKWKESNNLSVSLFIY